MPIPTFLHVARGWGKFFLSCRRLSHRLARKYFSLELLPGIYGSPMRSYQCGATTVNSHLKGSLENIGSMAFRETTGAASKLLTIRVERQSIRRRWSVRFQLRVWLRRALMCDFVFRAWPMRRWLRAACVSTRTRLTKTLFWTMILTRRMSGSLAEVRVMASNTGRHSETW